MKRSIISLFLSITALTFSLVALSFAIDAQNSVPKPQPTPSVSVLPTAPSTAPTTGAPPVETTAPQETRTQTTDPAGGGEGGN